MDVRPVKLAVACLVFIFVVILQMAYIGSQLSSKCSYFYKSQLPFYSAGDREISMSRRLPQALIIGARKGGTRALLDAMALHPKIKAAKREVHFFDQNDTFNLGFDWYREQMPFSAADEITVEKTPAYFASVQAPERVHQMNPKMKLIVIVKNPVTRTISDFTQVLSTKTERNKTLPSFESVAFVEGTNRINLDYKPVRNSLYAEHLKNWLRYFPLEQFLFIDGDKFIVDPVSRLKELENFFGLAHEIADDQLVFNEYKGFYCFRKREKKVARCLGTSKGRTHVPVSPFTQQLLAKNFEKFNQKFFKMVNKRFNWNSEY